MSVSLCIVARTCAEPWYNWFITFSCMYVVYVARYFMFNVGNLGHCVITWGTSQFYSLFGLQTTGFCLSFVDVLLLLLCVSKRQGGYGGLSTPSFGLQHMKGGQCSQTQIIMSEALQMSTHTIWVSVWWHVHSAKTKISLGIRPVWLFFAAAWRKLRSFAAH